MAANWFIQRKMHNGGWYTVSAGYDGEAKAKAAAARQAKSSMHATRWRAGFDAGLGCAKLFEAEFVPGKRAEWAPVPAPSPQPEHVASPDCWCSPELEYADEDTGAKVYVHREIQ